MLTAFAQGTLFGERTGSEPVRVVALHGWRKSHADLSAVVSDFDAVSLDLPGFGASPQPTEVWGAHEYAASIVPVLEQLPEPPVLFGHSFGGRVALAAAADRPDLVKALVLTGVPLIRRPGTAKPPLKFRLAKLANKVGLLSNERMEQERQKRGSADYRAATGVMRDIFVRLVNESYEQEIQSVRCPVLMVWGENDTAAPLWQAREADELFADSELVVIPDGSHWLPNENPEVLRDAIRKFVK
jgi:pimeloyl-ACP methyl ester carboxylesterase